jgi:hypothetical protein
MLLGVNVDFVTATLPPVRMTRVAAVSRPAGRVSGNGPLFTFHCRQTPRLRSIDC